MLSFAMMTRLAASALRSPQSLEEIEKQVMERIVTECPDVHWVHNYAVLGGCDYLDIFTAPDIETAMKVATIVRTFGHATTEVWSVSEWAAYKELIRRLPPGDVAGAGEGI
jgi:uncharacterized protein with GYD domain